MFITIIENNTIHDTKTMKHNDAKFKFLIGRRRKTKMILFYNENILVLIQFKSTEIWEKSGGIKL